MCIIIYSDLKLYNLDKIFKKMLHRLYVRSKFSKSQIAVIIIVNALMSFTIVKPYFTELAATANQKKKNEIDKKELSKDAEQK